MTLKSHVMYFLRHVFSPRIFALNLFNQVFWILVIAGAAVGFKRGLLSACIGGAAGAVAGLLFLGFSYALYVVTHRNQFNAEPGDSPNDGRHR